MTTATARRYWTLADIRQANRRSGYRFFDPAAMRFFGSRAHSVVHQGSGGVYFVTSETDIHGRSRAYTVRRFDPVSGRCGLAEPDGFRAFRTARQAHARAAALSRR